jgi:formylglycine-generating enzyme required for sulfatase activity
MLAVAVLLAGLACYEPHVASCAVFCEDGSECPEGTVCSAGYCNPPGVSGTSCSVSPADASPFAVDAAPLVVNDAGRPVDDMVTVPAGVFMMGCAGPPLDRKCYSDEPLHSVELSEYEIDRTEISQRSYALCVDGGDCPAPDSALYQPSSFPTWPVVGLNRDMAEAYCAWVGKRLPTEAEWEKAARGSGDVRIYPWGSSPEPACGVYAHFAPSGCASTSPIEVAQLSEGASPYGALDMAGNVWEWVADWYARNYYDSSPATDPQGPVVGTEGVLRGGGFLTGEAQYLRVSNRNNRDPANTANTYGARCARSL